LYSLACLDLPGFSPAHLNGARWVGNGLATVAVVFAWSSAVASFAPFDRMVAACICTQVSRRSRSLVVLSELRPGTWLRAPVFRLCVELMPLQLKYLCSSTGGVNGHWCKPERRAVGIEGQRAR
jgi:hypothetical protein